MKAECLSSMQILLIILGPSIMAFYRSGPMTNMEIDSDVRFHHIVTMGKFAKFQHFPQGNIIDNISLVNQSGCYDFTVEYNKNRTNVTNMHRYPGLMSNFSFYHLKDVYYAQLGMYRPLGSPVVYHFDRWKKHFPNVTVKRSFANVMAVTCISSGYYGDLFFATLGRMAFMPPGLISKSHIIFCGKLRSVVEEFCATINERCQIVQASTTEFFYAKNLYSVFPNWYSGDRIDQNEVHHAYNGPIVCHMINKLLKIYKLENVVPTLYVMINRVKGMKRFCQNFDEIYDAAKRAHPEYNIEKGPHIFKTIKQTAYAYVHYKWLFCPSGSNMMNAMFMSPQTTVCYWDTGQYDNPAMTSMLARHINCVAFQTVGNVYTRKPFIIDVEIALKYINRSLEISEAGGFGDYKKICR